MKKFNDYFFITDQLKALTSIQVRQLHKRSGTVSGFHQEMGFTPERSRRVMSQCNNPVVKEVR